MKTPNHNKYVIQITGSKFQCIEANGDRGKGFTVPDILDDRSKLYIVKKGKIIYYVGITIQDIRKRLRDGFIATGNHGYYGYKWKSLDMVELLVWCFPSSTMEQLEAVEAELVYFIREKTGKWPKYQMEIHFHEASAIVRRVARKILKTCFE